MRDYAMRKLARIRRATMIWSLALPLSLLLSVGAVGQKLSDWSAPINLGPVVNTSSLDAGAFITKDGLSLYIASDRPGGFGGTDLWVSQRDTNEDPWGPPQNLGPTINTAGNDITPVVSSDGHLLFFSSNGPGGLGLGDLYVSRRRNTRDDFGWQPPVNLGPSVNTVANETGPALVCDRKDDGNKDDDAETVTLYFNSNRSGNIDIYASTLEKDGVFGPAVLVQELSTASVDQRPAIGRDGLEMFFDSDRPGGFGALDIWVSRRESTKDPWGEPENLGPTINTSAIEGRAAISFDRLALYFLSTRPGGFGAQDIYVSTRSKIKE